MRRVLDIGHGGHPMGNLGNAKLETFIKRLPLDTEYHGIDIRQRQFKGVVLPHHGVGEKDVLSLELQATQFNHLHIQFYRMDGRSLSFRIV